VSAGGGRLDDEAVDASAGAAQDQDTQMLFDPADYAEGPLPMLHRPKFLAIVSSNTLATTMLRRAGDGELVLRGVVGGEGVKHAGNVERDARAHEHVAHAGQHCAVDGGQMGELDLLKEVDADRVLVAFPSQEHLDKVADDAEFDNLL